MKHIRPSRVFTKVNTKRDGEEIIKLVFPSVNTPKLLHSAVLVSLARLVNAKTFFEFGTYLGIQTLNIAMNVPSLVKIYTLDLDYESYKDAKLDEQDVPLSLKHFTFEFEEKLAFLGSPYEKMIERLYGDTNKFDFSNFEGKIDFVYVDGGHDLRTLKSDTQNALKMLRPNSLACIAWHDYGNPKYPHLTQYLDDLSTEIKIYHVEETMGCFYLQKGEDIDFERQIA